MKRESLHFRFHNPNKEETAAAYLIKILVEANMDKALQAVHAACPRKPETARDSMDQAG